MRTHRLLPLMLTASLSVLPGCYTLQQTEAQAPMFKLSQDLDGPQLDYAHAYTRATWVHSQLSAGDWARAHEDLDALQRDVQTVLETDSISASIRTRVNMLMPTIQTLHEQINERDEKALRTAGNLVSLFRSTTDSLVARGWLGPKGDAVKLKR